MHRSRYSVKMCSKAESKQRCGRAGRVQEGTCYYLYSSFINKNRKDYALSDVETCDQHDLTFRLALIACRYDETIESVVKLMLTSPCMDDINNNIEYLQECNILDCNNMLTPKGNIISRLGLDIKSGMLIFYGMMFGCLDNMITLAAFNDNMNIWKYIIYNNDDEKKNALYDIEYIKEYFAEGAESDGIMYINMFNAWYNRELEDIHMKYFNMYVFNKVNSTRQNILKKCGNILNKNSFYLNDGNYTLIKLAILFANRSFTAVCNSTVDVKLNGKFSSEEDNIRRISDQSVVSNIGEEYFVCYGSDISLVSKSKKSSKDVKLICNVTSIPIYMALLCYKHIVNENTITFDHFDRVLTFSDTEQMEQVSELCSTFSEALDDMHIPQELLFTVSNFIDSVVDNNK